MQALVNEGAFEDKFKNHFIQWSFIKHLIQKYKVVLNLLDETLSQVIFWTPYSTEQQYRWREILYGLISLQRMAISMTAQENIDESYGTTIVITPKTNLLISTTFLRVLITIVQSLIPTFLEMSKLKNRSNVRLILEKVKFSLRFLLLGSYWFQLFEEGVIDCCGILMNGGMFDPEETVFRERKSTIEDVVAWRKRQTYVGSRTGRRVIDSNNNLSNKNLQRNESTTIKKILQRQQHKFSWICTIVSEMWHLYRPLHWAQIENLRYPYSKDLSCMLGLDIISIFLLIDKHPTANNRELRRRKMKLLLYSLRYPFFEKYTRPATSRFFRTLKKMPILGSLLESYFHDCFLYWKHPFVTEAD